MQRWRHARRGPKVTLVLAVLVAIGSLCMYQAAYATTAVNPYPGPPAGPHIPPGPYFGCTPTGTTKATWVCGFNALSTVTFKVDGKAAGTGTADSNGCILVVVSFLNGEVSVNGNAPVPVHPGANYIEVLGTKNSNHVAGTVGLRLSFTTPPHGTNTCAIAPPPPLVSTTVPTVSPVTQVSIPPRITSTTFAIVTTSHPTVPTTLAKVIETPLEISPNKVILESSLLAALLSLLLAAGALGSVWRGDPRRRPNGPTRAPAGDPGEGAPGGADSATGASASPPADSGGAW